jgi:uncharacterized protein (TIGR02145 family)
VKSLNKIIMKNKTFRRSSLLLLLMSPLALSAQVDICTGTSYTIASVVPASADGGATITYRWLENGQVVNNATAATYTVPAGKAAGYYAYVRQAKTAGCDEWQPSNEFTVTVFACTFTAGTATGATATFTDPRDGKRYKTVVMPDGKTWFAQDLNYTKDLTANAYSYAANGKPYTTLNNGVPAIGSYWCPPQFTEGTTSTVSGTEADCNVYGALYTWETAMMVDGKYADETKSSSAWDEGWVSSNYFSSGAPGATANANINNARGAVVAKGGGRGICPKGWHVPTDREWAAMLDKVEGDGSGSIFTDQTDFGWMGSDAGQKLKSTGTYTGTTDDGKGGWKDSGSSTTHGTNLTAFSAVPAGIGYGSRFGDRGHTVSYWTASVGSSSTAWYRALSYYNVGVILLNSNRSVYVSVRCVKDQKQQ